MRQGRGRDLRTAGRLVAPQFSHGEERQLKGPVSGKRTRAPLGSTLLLALCTPRVLRWVWGSCHGHHSRRLLCGSHLRPHHHKLPSAMLLSSSKQSVLTAELHTLPGLRDGQDRTEAADPHCHPIRRTSSSPQHVGRPANRQY